MHSRGPATTAGTFRQTAMLATRAASPPVFVPPSHGLKLLLLHSVLRAAGGSGWRKGVGR